MLSTIILFIYFNLFGYDFLELNTDIMAPYQCHICPCQSNIQGVNTVVYSFGYGFLLLNYLMFVTLMPCLYVLLCGPKIRNKDSCILYSTVKIHVQYQP